MEVMVNLVKKSVTENQQVKHWASVAIMNICKSRDDVPKAIADLISEESLGASRTIIGKKLVDLIDASQTVAMRLTKKAPDLEHFFQQDATNINQQNHDDDNDNDDNDNDNDNDNDDNDNDDNDNDDEREQEQDQNSFEQRRTSLLPKTLDEEESDIIQFSDLEIDHNKVIGVGSYGLVYRGKLFGTVVAVKELYLLKNNNNNNGGGGSNLTDEAELMNDHLQKLIMREVNMLKRSRHPNIIEYMGVSLPPTNTASDHHGIETNDGSHVAIPALYIIMEFVEGGDLRALLKDKTKEIPWIRRIAIAIDICVAMCYLHSRNILHRDLKSKNILIETVTNKAKLCDFGFARDIQQQHQQQQQLMTMKVGTDQWMSPEVTTGQSYSFQADVFSFGCCLLELISREKPPVRFPKDNYAFQQEDLFKIWKLVSPQISDFRPFLFKSKDKSIVKNVQKEADIRSQMPSLLPQEEFAILALECIESKPEKRPNFQVCLKKLTRIERKISRANV